MATSGGKIGEISVKGYDHVEWTIKDISSYDSKNKFYLSPYFTIAGFKWCFSIFPSGLPTLSTVEGLVLYLRREADSAASPVAVTYSFGVKKVDGTVEEIGSDMDWVFEKAGYTHPKFLLRSKLLEKKPEMAPSDVLTLICNLRVTESLDSSERMDELSQNLVDMFISKRGCDATLKVKQETFSVHKAILSARSPVLAAMFEAEMKEKNTGVADIVDCEPEAFKEFLLYLYSGKIENISTHVFDLYKIADKYDVRGLKSACIISMMSRLSLENVLDVCVLGNQTNRPELKNKAQEFFNKNFQDIIATEKWESLLRDDYRLANELLKKMARK